MGSYRPWLEVGLKVLQMTQVDLLRSTILLESLSTRMAMYMLQI